MNQAYYARIRINLLIVLLGYSYSIKCSLGHVDILID